MERMTRTPTRLPPWSTPGADRGRGDRGPEAGGAQQHLGLGVGALGILLRL